MSAGRTFKALAAGTAFRVTGAGKLGRLLTDEYLNADEDTRTVAGIMLVRAKDKSIGVLAEALGEGKQVEDVLDVLASIESELADHTLAQIAADVDHPASGEARRVLERRKRPGGVDGEG